MQCAPVMRLIKFIMVKEISITTRPIMAKVRVFLAPSTCFGSPPDVRNFMPEKNTKKRATTVEKPKTQLRTREKIAGRQEIVATSPFIRHSLGHCIRKD